MSIYFTVGLDGLAAASQYLRVHCEPGWASASEQDGLAR
jgi:hypothetical protein